MGHAVEDAAAAAIVLERAKQEVDEHAVSDHPACSGAWILEPSWRGLGRRPSDLDAELLGAGEARAPQASHSTAKAELKRAAAARALRAELAAALRAVRRQLVHELLEVALHEPAAEAERDPVAQRLAPLLAQPVRRLAHRRTVARPIARVPRDGNRAGSRAGRLAAGGQGGGSRPRGPARASTAPC